MLRIKILFRDGTEAISYVFDDVPLADAQKVVAGCPQVDAIEILEYEP